MLDHRVIHRLIHRVMVVHRSRPMTFNRQSVLHAVTHNATEKSWSWDFQQVDRTVAGGQSKERPMMINLMRSLVVQGCTIWIIRTS
jgi:hypothetical protein